MLRSHMILTQEYQTQNMNSQLQHYMQLFRDIIYGGLKSQTGKKQEIERKQGNKTRESRVQCREALGKEETRHIQPVLYSVLRQALVLVALPLFQSPPSQPNGPKVRLLFQPPGTGATVKARDMKLKEFLSFLILFI